MAEKLSARELDRLAGTEEGHTNLIETRLGANVGGQTLAKLTAVLGITTDWLITGEGRDPVLSRVRASVEAARNAKAA